MREPPMQFQPQILRRQIGINSRQHRELTQDNFFCTRSRLLAKGLRRPPPINSHLMLQAWWLLYLSCFSRAVFMNTFSCGSQLFERRPAGLREVRGAIPVRLLQRLQSRGAPRAPRPLWSWRRSSSLHHLCLHHLQKLWSSIKNLFPSKK